MARHHFYQPAVFICTLHNGRSSVVESFPGQHGTMLSVLQSNTKRARRFQVIRMKFTRYVSSQFLISMILVPAALAVSQGLTAQEVSNENAQTAVSSYATAIIDPDVIDSEWNHHLSGYILIVSAGLLLLSLCFDRVAFLRAVWPFLFIA